MSSWAEANQRWLAASLAVLRGTLERHAGAEADGGDEDARAALEAAAAALDDPPALERLAGAFGLSDFERDLLLMAAGVELDAGFAALCREAAGARGPTFSLALAALPGAHWSALTPAAPLRYWRLLEVSPGEALAAGPLRIDERVLHFLAGTPCLDERLQGLVEPVAPPEHLAPSHARAAERVAALWAAPATSRALVCLCGDERGGKRAVAAAAAEHAGMGLHALRAGDVPAAAADREALVRLWEREAVLSGSALLLEMEDGDGPEVLRAAGTFAARLRAPVLAAAREPVRAGARPVARVDVDRPEEAEQAELWTAALGDEAAASLNGHLGALVAQFSLGAREIAQAGAEARVEAAEGAALADALWTACRRQARPRLDDLAQRIDSGAAWDDLVLPEGQTRILREIALHVRHRAQVYGEWGFGRRGARGLGISALFAGPSGTGKTLAAEVIAGELRLDLYRIDLSQVVSKYIGETEKNLRRVFDAAEEGGAVLLFDEADALFGKRSEVKDSHDRYANVEVSYLLQRMEQYRGLAVLTTNLKDALDTAFLRRLRFVVQFPFPDAAQRAEIWRRAFPGGTPTEGVDAEKLSRLNVAGGNIRNIALNAAFAAAGEGAPVRMAHLLYAARTEFAKLERPLGATEVAGWV
jgi:ATPase family associated with various cellular activities (AAA)